jgi:protein-L-isoaspartate(D-aspartate) O-methyltransferase
LRKKYVNNDAWENLVQSLIQEGILHSPNVIRAMQLVPREKFLPENSKSFGSVDAPLPIGWGQTVSAPHNKQATACWAKHGFNNE